MKINPSKLGLSFGLVAAVLWVVCSLLVMLMPMEMMSMTGNMVHSDLSNMHWDMGAAGLFVGLVACLEHNRLR